MKITEIDLRVSLAKYLISIKHKDSCIFATEARYGFGDRRADFVMVDNFSHAFEIKSDFDTTARLPDQLEEYMSTFDFVTIVTTPAHLNKIRKLTTTKIGLLLHRQGKIHQLRMAKQNKRLSKNHLSSSITRERLIKEIFGLKKNSSLEEAQSYAVKKLTTNQLRKMFINELRSRFSASSELFFQETDNEINEEDLLLLKRTSHLWFGN